VILGVDLVRQLVTLPDRGEASFTIDPFARECLLAGVDEIGYVLGQEAAIARFESARMARRTCTLTFPAVPRPE
jgi:3-isopropylmalate/(R)-2-methylmalate dehydratase small subunit